MAERSVRLELKKIDAINYDQMEKHISKNGFLITKVNDLINWARSGSLWPMSFGLACCFNLVKSLPGKIFQLDG